MIEKGTVPLQCLCLDLNAVVTPDHCRRLVVIIVFQVTSVPNFPLKATSDICPGKDIKEDMVHLTLFPHIHAMFYSQVFLFALSVIFGLVLSAKADAVVYEGRVPLSFANSDLDTSTGPFLTAVKGSEAATHYSQVLGNSTAPTSLWASTLTEQVISITIDNTSVFVPGGGAPQNGFRRTELIAQNKSLSTSLNDVMEVGVTRFHFSVKENDQLPLNFTHEYQVVFIEPSDGTHVFELQIGTPFTNPTQSLPSSDAYALKIRDHSLNLLFSTDFTPSTWHNFAVQVDWDQRTLQVFYSTDGETLEAVTDVVQNSSAGQGATGEGDFHFGVLKLPLVNPDDSTANQNDVVHFGIQEGTTEGLLYSGIFVETISS
ncbi:hypothetical protein D9758_011333 [Tetrapyrgos nigripes]|uniref:Glycoside hydrolase 131 catalytic N-terminal domain-containing protein n=1 Tax=Tetrapyrgos nigripes TaxID=182062 RepID=A0A8H5G8F1_9AGAR|nr:hypothetical protein D9758_011333 [Tetrapyrgos nigripes]